jgi:DNA-binding MarR family transcriptional regulator
VERGAAATSAGSPENVASVDRLTRELRTFVRALHALKACAPNAYVERSALMLLPRLEERSCRLRELAEAVHADPSTVSRQVSELVDLGLVRREADPRDGRATLLAITPEGLAACEDLRRRRRSLLEPLVAEWPVERVDAFSDLLRAFTSEVEVRTRDDGSSSRPAADKAAEGGRPFPSSA